MSNVSDAIQLRLSTATALTDLVEDRIYPVTPTEATALPFVVHTITGTEPVNTLDGQVSLTKYNVDVDCYGVNYDAVQNIQAIVKGLLNNWRGGIVQDSTLVSSQSTPTDDGYSGTQTYQVWADPGDVAGTASISVGTDDVTISACEHTLTVNCDGILLDGAPIGTPDLSDYARKSVANTFTASQTVVGMGEPAPTTEVGGGSITITNNDDSAFISSSGMSWSGSNIALELQEIPGGQTTTFTPDGITTPGPVRIGEATSGYGGVGFAGTLTTGNAALFGNSSSTALQAPSGGNVSVRIGNDFGGQGGLDFIGAGKVGINNNSPTASLHVKAFSASTVGSIVQGFTGQTANLQEWQDSTGGIVGYVSPAAKLQLRGSNAQIELFGPGAQATSLQMYSAGGLKIVDSGNTGNTMAQVNSSRNFSVFGPEVHTGVEVRLGSVYNAYPGVYSTGAACLIGETGITLRNYGNGASIFTQTGWRVTPGTGATYAMRWDDGSGDEVASVATDGGANFTGNVTVGGNGGSPGNNYLDIKSFGNNGWWRINNNYNGGICKLSIGSQNSGATPVEFNSNGTTGAYGAWTHETNSASVVPLTVKGATGQTASLQQWQTSAGTTVGSIGADGSFSIGTGAGGDAFSLMPSGNNYSYYLNTGNSGIGTFGLASNSTINFTDGIQTPLSIYTNAYAGTPVCTVNLQGAVTATGLQGGNVPFTVKEAASQTADAFRVQDSSGNVYARINQNSSGDRSQLQLAINGTTTSLFAYSTGDSYLDIASTKNFYVRTGGGGNQVAKFTPTGVVVPATAAGNVPLTVMGTTSQSGNLQEWQSSTGAVVASVKPDGMFYAVQATTTGMTFGFDGTYIGLQRTGAGAGQIVSYNTTTGDTHVNSSFSSGTGVRIQSMGTTGIYVQENKLGFFGATPVAKPSALTTAVATTAVSSDAAIIDNLRTRINELESKLQALGLLA